MKTHGCVGAMLLICGCGFSAACNRGDGLNWAMQRYADSIKPAQIDDQPPQGISDYETPAKPAEMQRDKQVAERVQRYIDAVPRKDEPSGDLQQRAEVAHRQPQPAPQAGMSKLIGSMGPASLESVDSSSGSRPTLPVITSVTVRAANAQREPEPPMRLVAANSSLQPMQSLPPTAVVREIERLERQLSEQPNDLAGHLRLRYLYLAEGRLEKAKAPPAGLDPDRAVLLMKWMNAAVTVERSLQDPSLVSAETASALRDLQDWAGDHADLEIARLVLCTSIHSYGRFDPIPEGFLASGRANRAFVYCEVRNFGSEMTTGGKYRTRIAHHLELLTPQGHSVWKDSEQMEVADECLNRRHDFFFNRLFELPRGINPGHYILKITVEDKIKLRVDEATLPLEIKPASSAGY